MTRALSAIVALVLAYAAARMVAPILPYGMAPYPWNAAPDDLSLAVGAMCAVATAVRMAWIWYRER